MRYGLVLAALLLLWNPASLGFDAGPASLKDILRLAGAWVQRFADDSAFIVGEEVYDQDYRSKDGRPLAHRRLLSEIVFVRTPEEEVRAGHPWVQFRDVVEADGLPLPEHRGRLERLFKDAGPSAYAQAQAMVDESARYNIGPGVRTVNVPSFALFFLHPQNQSRFRFEIAKPTAGDASGGRGDPLWPPTTVAIQFRERDRPTMIKSVTRQDLPASGIMWIEPQNGRVLKTRMDVQVARHWGMTTEVTYGHDPGTDAWVPQTMHEMFRDDEVLECRARYSNYRRFRTSGRLIVK